jgi:hypothetical protein
MQKTEAAGVACRIDVNFLHPITFRNEETCATAAAGTTAEAC